MILIKPMQVGHLDAVHAIECACFTTPWSRESLLREITRNELSHYVCAMLYEALREPEVVGYAGMWQIGDEGHITNLAVKERHRQNGVASMILSHLDGLSTRLDITALTLEVRVSNIPAQKLYAKHGFETKGRRKGYYADTGEDAFIMWKTVGGQL